MDEPVGSDPERATRVEFAPLARLTVGSGVLTVVAALVALAAPAPPGRLLFGLAGVLLAAYTLADWLWRPHLSVDADGITVRSPWVGLRALNLRWDELDRVRVDEQRRHGARMSALELESGDRLIVLTRRALGTDPDRVAATIAELRPH